MAHELYDCGCRLILVARNEQQLRQVQQALHANKPLANDCHTMVLDLENVESIREVTTKAIAIYDRIDILINNAGISFRGEIEDTKMSVYRKLMEVNYFAQIALTKGTIFFHPTLNRLIQLLLINFIVFFTDNFSRFFLLIVTIRLIWFFILGLLSISNFHR